jgi:hypothetical protein
MLENITVGAWFHYPPFQGMAINTAVVSQYYSISSLTLIILCVNYVRDSQTREVMGPTNRSKFISISDFFFL